MIFKNFGCCKVYGLLKIVFYNKSFVFNFSYNYKD